MPGPQEAFGGLPASGAASFMAPPQTMPWEQIVQQFMGTPGGGGQAPPPPVAPKPYWQQPGVSTIQDLLGYPQPDRSGGYQMQPTPQLGGPPPAPGAGQTAPRRTMPGDPSGRPTAPNLDATIKRLLDKKPPRTAPQLNSVPPILRPSTVRPTGAQAPGGPPQTDVEKHFDTGKSGNDLEQFFKWAGQQMPPVQNDWMEDLKKHLPTQDVSHRQPPLPAQPVPAQPVPTPAGPIPAHSASQAAAFGPLTPVQPGQAGAVPNAASYGDIMDYSSPARRNAPPPPVQTANAMTRQEDKPFDWNELFRVIGDVGDGMIQAGSQGIGLAGGLAMGASNASKGAAGRAKLTREEKREDRKDRLAEMKFQLEAQKANRNPLKSTVEGDGGEVFAVYEDGTTSSLGIKKSDKLTKKQALDYLADVSMDVDPGTGQETINETKWDKNARMINRPDLTYAKMSGGGGGSAVSRSPLSPEQALQDPQLGPQMQALQEQVSKGLITAQEAIERANALGVFSK